METKDNNFTEMCQRLLDERKELLERTLKLKAAIDNPEMKLNAHEWDMLRHQFCAMRDYLQALTDRCTYYGLIPAGNLNLDYQGPRY